MNIYHSIINGYWVIIGVVDTACVTLGIVVTELTSQRICNGIHHICSSVDPSFPLSFFVPVMEISAQHHPKS